LQGLEPDEIRALLGLTREFAEQGPRPVLTGRTVATLFFEDSTRTRTSFMLAASRLGATVVDLSGAGTSMSKGETPTDTAQVIEAMGVDAIVVRDKHAGVPSLLHRAVQCSVLNAGDGKHEHPTQGLLDLYTLGESLGLLDSFDYSGLNIVIVGDLASSRVARSTTAGLSALGAHVTLVGPPTLAPRKLSVLGCDVSTDLDAALEDADAVMMLRIQFERGAGRQLAGVADYRVGYALDPERAARLKPGAVVLHPGPINRGVELDTPVADGGRSVVLRQVRNGVFVRMAALSACMATLPA